MVAQAGSMNTMHQVLSPPPASIDRCWQLLLRWRAELKLTRREQGVLSGSLVVLDRQLERLKQRRLRIAVFGRVGVGKSSLINALIGEAVMDTDVAHGNTRRQQSVRWPIPWPTGHRTGGYPGIDEIHAGPRPLARRIALEDLVLLVIDSDLTRSTGGAEEHHPAQNPAALSEQLRVSPTPRRSSTDAISSELIAARSGLAGRLEIEGSPVAGLP